MDVGQLSQNALSGIHRGVSQANEASQKLAGREQLSGENTNSSKELIALKEAETQVQISAKVAQTAGDVIGSIIDIKA